MNIEQLTKAAVATVRSDLRDLTPRQLAILLLVNKGPQTVRGLAAALDIGKPAVTRNSLTLTRYGFMRRVKVEKDARDLNLVVTEAGQEFIAAYMALISNPTTALKMAA